MLMPAEIVEQPAVDLQLAERVLNGGEIEHDDASLSDVAHDTSIRPQVHSRIERPTTAAGLDIVRSIAVQYHWGMGTFYTPCRVENHSERHRHFRVPKLHVDTDSEATWLPADKLTGIGIRREKRTSNSSWRTVS